MYYLDYTFPDFHGTGSMEYLFDSISFNVEVVKNLETEDVTGFLKYYTSSGDYQIGVRGYPYEEHMQVIASLVRI